MEEHNEATSAEDITEIPVVVKTEPATDSIEAEVTANGLNINNDHVAEKNTTNENDQTNDMTSTYTYLNGNASNQSHDHEMNIKTEIDSETQVLVLNKHNNFNARQKPKSSTLRHDCDKCDEAFQYPYQLARHREVIHEGKYPFHCKVCSKPFDRKSGLQDHMYVHSEERPYPCKVCDKRFKMKSNMKKHMREIHNEDSGTPQLKFQCEYCSKIFLTKERLTSHFIVHETEKHFACDICGKKFNRKSNLKIHLLMHSSEKNFKCPDCHMCFNRKYSLKIHARNHLAVKPYKCEQCPMSFSQLHALKTHFRQHTGEKPFKCTVCPQTFRQLATLQVHLKRHSGVKDFKCMLCDRAFVIKRRLTEHMRLHTGEKPYSCKQCDHKTATSSGLRLHLKTHQRQEERARLRELNQSVSEGSDSSSRNNPRPVRSARKNINMNVNEIIEMTVNAAIQEDKESSIDGKNRIGNEVVDDLEINDNDSVHSDDDISVNSNTADTSVCEIEIINDEEFETDDTGNMKVDGSGIDDMTEIKVKVQKFTDVITDCSEHQNAINGIADCVGNGLSLLPDSSDLDLVNDEPVSENEITKDQTELSFKFSASEILYKHLNEFIPAINAELLSEKVDCIVSEMIELHETMKNEKPTEGTTSKKSQPKSTKSVNSRVKKRNANKRLIEALTTTMDKTHTEHEPFNETASNSIVQKQTISDIQASHRTLSQSLLSGRESSPIKTLLSGQKSMPGINPLLHNARESIPATNTLHSQNSMSVSSQLLGQPSMPSLTKVSDKDTYSAGAQNFSNKSLPSLKQYSGPVTVPAAAVRSGHELNPASTLLSTLAALTPVSVKQEPGISQDDSMIGSVSSILDSTIQSMLMSSPNVSKNNSSILWESPGSKSPFNDSLGNKTPSLKSKSCSKPKSSLGNSTVLRGILSQPPQYLLDLSHSVAAMGHLNHSNNMTTPESNNLKETFGSENGVTNSEFPWTGISNIKMEPLSGDES